MSNDERLARLKQAVTETNITQVANRLGLPRCTVSLVVNEKYPANPKKILALFDAVYGGVFCPHLKRDLTRAQCRDFNDKPRPSSPLGLQHWRACRQCEHGTNDGEQS